MQPGPPKEVYTRLEARRVLGVSERQLRSWERQRLVPRLEQFAFSDLIALSSLKKLRQEGISALRIRKAVDAIREKLAAGDYPWTEMKIFGEGRDVAVIFDGRKMEPVSGQLLIDFDRRELAGLLAFPGARPPADGRGARRLDAERWFEKGLELEQTGAPLEEIVEAYRKAIELDPRSAGALVNLGTVYYHARDWTEAERCYIRALEIDPEYALAHFNLGNLYDELGRRDQAADHYEAALRISPSYADAHYNLALLCQSQNDVMRAVRHWKEYLKLDGGSSWAGIARRELEKLRKAAVLPGGQQQQMS